MRGTIVNDLMQRPPRVVGLGGTVRPGSSSEVALRAALLEAEAMGASTEMYSGRELAELPIFDPAGGEYPPLVHRLVESLRSADGIIVASPGYHGSVSGLVKNALDYTELMRDDARSYFAGRPVGLIVTAFGWQATTTTLATLRAVTHALRGWPTPYGAALNSATSMLKDVASLDDSVRAQLRLVASEVVRFAERMGASTAPDQVPAAV